MKGNPLVILTLILSLGIFTGWRTQLPFVTVYSFALCCFFISLLLRNKRGFGLSLCALVFSLGALIIINSQILSADHIFNHICRNNQVCSSVRGIVDSPPRKRGGKTTFILKAQEVQFGQKKYQCRGRIHVDVGSCGFLGYSDKVILIGRIYPIFSFGNSDQGSYKSYLKRQGIHALFYVDSPLGVIKLENRRRSLGDVFFYLRTRIQGMISEGVSPLAASIAEAIILGNRQNIPAPVYKLMANSGTVHILVVSGFHVGIVAFIAGLLLKLIRLRRRIRIFLIIPFLIAYCLVTGATIPVLRATLMVIVFISAYLVKREPDIYNSLSLAALAILIINPKDLFNIGFQLSFVSVISIVYLYPKIRRLLRLERIKIFGLRFFGECLAVSLSAWFGTAGLIWHYFRIFSPVAPLANIFIVPLAALITLGGFSLIFARLLLPGLAVFVALSLEFFIAIMLRLNAFLTGLPGAYFRG
ncbi:MAG: ComEC family competence protein [Candidatus Omnitrophica bacterium]|nr:ComEC family competence protein [Candidatus Omnitrophota bacterium]